MLRHFIFRISFFIFALSLTACGNKVILDEERTFSSTWNRFTPQQYEIAIPSSDLFFHIDYTVVVDTAVFRYDRLPLIVDIYGADGTQRHISPVIPLKENGRWKGQQEGPNRRVTARVHNYFTFNKSGTYRYEVKQATSQYDLEGVRAFSVHIEEAKLEYNLD